MLRISAKKKRINPVMIARMETTRETIEKYICIHIYISIPTIERTSQPREKIKFPTKFS